MCRTRTVGQNVASALLATWVWEEHDEECCSRMAMSMLKYTHLCVCTVSASDVVLNVMFLVNQPMAPDTTTHTRNVHV